jgi:non-specific serine/threonine protein kinase
VRETGSRPPLEMLADFLSEKRILLVLDNCEHLIDACASLAEMLLRECPRLTILASSREALGVLGENSYRVPSLDTPDPRQPLPLEELVQYESVRLFAERASTALPGFAVNPANAEAVAKLCRRLDGIPLAIELAAARVGMLTVEKIAARLDNRFRLLTGGSRTALPRQQTLRASIDWSYNLLPKPERLLLMRLSVFNGGWTLEAAEAICVDRGNRGSSAASAAEAVCGFESLEDFDIFERLNQLVKKSLVIAESQPGGEIRYHLLETIRQYAREKLLDTGDGETVRSRHLEFYTALAEQAEPHIRAFDQIAWNNRLAEEIDNLRIALVWSEEEGIENGLRIAWSIRWFCHSCGHAYRGEIAQWLDRVLPAHPLPDGASRAQIKIWANAFTAQAFLHFFLGKNQAKVLGAYGIGQALYESLGQEGKSGLVFLYQTWGANLMFILPDPIPAQEMMRKSLRIAEKLGLPNRRPA